MNSKLTFQICFCCFLIFALGIWVGRMNVLNHDEPDTFSTELTVSEVSQKEIRSATRRTYRRYQDILELTQEQTQALKPAFEQVPLKMRILPKHSKARLAVIEDFHDEISPRLNPNQVAKLDQILEDARLKRETD